MIRTYLLNNSLTGTGNSLPLGEHSLSGGDSFDINKIRYKVFIGQLYSFFSL